MSSTLEEQSTSGPSVESPPGATPDPTGTTNKLEKAVDQLNSHMDRMSTFWGNYAKASSPGNVLAKRGKLLHTTQRAQTSLDANDNAAVKASLWMKKPTALA